MTNEKKCFHCGLLVDNENYKTSINDIVQIFCCVGCLAVADFITKNNLYDYYAYREKQAHKIKNYSIKNLEKLKIYDNVNIQKDFIKNTNEFTKNIILLINGITCAACTWLIERHVKKLNGIKKISLNLVTHKANVTWNQNEISLSKILIEIKKLGYSAVPYTLKKQEDYYNIKSQRELKKLIIAGIGMSQIMMFSISLYVGEKLDMIEDYKIFLRFICLIISSFVLIYSGSEILVNFYNNIKTLRLGMDFPIGLSLIIAYISSIYNIKLNLEHVYFDSISMFVFFLLLARFLEMKVRHNSSNIIYSLQKVSSNTVTILKKENTIYVEKITKIKNLKCGDLILIKPGETIPIDGIITNGSSTVDESLITGEYIPTLKTIDNKVIGGSNNIDGLITIKVLKTIKKSLISKILTLLEKTVLTKPKITNTINKIASHFIIIVLIIITLTVILWVNIGNQDILKVIISMLVVTCPCALSIATPIAITTCTTLLITHGFLVTGENLLETLNHITDIVFDKTGTLTVNRFIIKKIITSNISKKNAFEIALNLEKHSHHPISKAFIKHKLFDKCINFNVNDLKIFPSLGIQGTVNNKEYRIGKLDFIKLWSSNKNLKDIDKKGFWIALADKDEIVAWFNLTNPLRKSASKCIEMLKSLKINIHILSGDSSKEVEKISKKLNIENAKKNLTADKKVLYIKKLQDKGSIVMMIGDGVNDAPAMNACQASISMGSGTDITKTNSDSVILNNNLLVIPKAIKYSRNTIKIIKENITWALIYNIIGLTLAGLGLLEPYYAAIGMSLSSLIVIFNSKKLLWYKI